MIRREYIPNYWWEDLQEEDLEVDPRDEPSLTLEEIPSVPLEQEEPRPTFVYLVVEYDWEAHVNHAGYVDAYEAEQRAARLNATVRNGPHGIREFGVEDQEIAL